MVTQAIRGVLVPLVGVSWAFASAFAQQAAGGDEHWDPEFGANGLNEAGLAIEVSSSGDVYVGARFTTAGGVAASHVARWDGRARRPLGSGVNGGVETLAVAVSATGIEPDLHEALDSGIALSVFPNPVRDHCSLEIELDRSQRLTAHVYDVRGRRVLVEELGELRSGTHIRPLDFSRLAAGSYVVRVIGAGFQSSTVLVSKAG